MLKYVFTLPACLDTHQNFRIKYVKKYLTVSAAFSELRVELFEPARFGVSFSLTRVLYLLATLSEFHAVTRSDQFGFRTNGGTRRLFRNCVVNKGFLKNSNISSLTTEI